MVINADLCCLTGENTEALLSVVIRLSRGQYVTIRKSCANSGPLSVGTSALLMREHDTVTSPSIRLQFPFVSGATVVRLCNRVEAMPVDLEGNLNAKLRRVNLD